jgi:hypothetical protein
MTSSHDLPACPAGNTSPDPGAARPGRRRAAALLAAAAPLAAALAAAFATSTPPAARSHTHTAELLAASALPATTAGTAFTDPKIPEASGD